MDAKLNEEKVMDQRLQKMPFVSGNYGNAPSYAIFRCGKKYKTIPHIKGFIKHMIRDEETLNSDPERIQNNEQIYGAADLYEDTKEYLSNCKIYTNSVIGRELLCTCSPQFFKGMTKSEFDKWVYSNLNWLKNTFGSNLRAVYLHMDETSPHLHSLVIPKLWSEKRKYYSLQNYKYFNGVQMLRDMQDNYAEAMQKDFPVLQRGIKGSRAKHNSMKKLYTITNEVESDSREVLEAKAAKGELARIKANHMDKTLKSVQHFNNKLQEENKKLLEQIEALKKDGSTKDIKEVIEKDQVKEQKKTATISKGFSGKRYNKSI